MEFAKFEADSRAAGTPIVPGNTLGILRGNALVLVGVAVGVDRAGRWVDSAWGELPRGDGSRLLGLLMILLSLPGAAFFTIAYGRNCADIYFQHIELADRLNEGQPVRPGRLGTHDAQAADPPCCSGRC